MMSDKCRGCKWWLGPIFEPYLYKAAIPQVRRECKRFPDSTIKREDDWCGEYKEKK